MGAAWLTAALASALFPHSIGFIFEAGFCFVALVDLGQSGLKLDILLNLPSKRWDYRSTPPCPVFSLQDFAL